MCRPLLVAIGLALATGRLGAQEAIPAETVTAVKQATVFVRVETRTAKGSGSGFVVASDREGLLIATNYHVASLLERDQRARLTPVEVARNLESAKISVVFNSGTPTEITARAVALAGDADVDLAILRVTGVKTLPKPIDYLASPKLVETMPVYLFGFPFGEALAAGNGAPAITVGKGSVSSLRYDEKNQLAVVQIDGALNPGNSGGPVVDSKGHLVGVAVATLRNGQGIGFAVPAAELAKVLKGSLGRVHVTATKAGEGKFKIRAEVGVIDPTASLRGVTLHYLVVDSKGKKPDLKDSVDKHPAAKKFSLKIERGIASGEVTVDAAAGDLFVQAMPEGGAGRAAITAIRTFGLRATGAVALGTPGSGAGDVPPPAGWKEFRSAKQNFKVWFPENAKPIEKQQTFGRGAGGRVSSDSIIAEMPGGPVYLIERISIFPPIPIRERATILKVLRDIATGSAPGPVTTTESDARLGAFPGKEYLIERTGSATRARAFVVGNVYLIRVMGTREQVLSDDSTTFLNSCRFVAVTPPTPPALPKPGGGTVGGTGTNIAGTNRDPEFKDLVPPGGTLVGLEFGLGKDGASTVVKAVRAIFRVGDKDTRGPWHGPTSPDIVKDFTKVVARSGYAVGGFSVRTGSGIVGLSVTFMKIAGNKLEPKDSYESQWIGSNTGSQPIKIGGTGEAATGLIGKSNATTASALGLLFTGPTPPPNAVTSVSPPTNPPATPPANPPAKPPVQRPTVVGRGPRIQGGGNIEFKDIGPTGGLLVGMEVGLGRFVNNDTVIAVRPIYRVGDKESLGDQYGTDTSRPVKVVAKAGYAVGALTLRTGLGLDGFSLTFMKVVDGKLDPNDSYESDWIGGPGGFSAVKIEGDGKAVIGLLGRTNGKNVAALGLAYVGEKPWPPGKPTRVQGGGDLENRDGAPAGGLLVGFEIGLGKWFNNDVVKAIRPIYRVGDKESFGEQYGTDTSRVVKVVAKPGYAVGAIMIKTGLGIDGMSVIFMKVADGKLDPKENYESEWIGGMGGGGLVRITGEGKLVIGSVVKTNAKDATGIGLLLQDANKK